MERGVNLVWIDCEMTGLDPSKDVILEIATIITDNSLAIIEEGPSLVIHQDDSALRGMSDVVRNLHKPSQLIDEVKESTITLREAEEKTLAFLKDHCEQGLAPLCGNSVWNDRNFLQAYMPRIIQYLHYRMIDVTSVKELVARWYPNDPDLEFSKKETHRALPDIKESIAELRHYRKYFFV